MNDIRAVALTSGHPNQPAVHPVTDLSTKRTQPLQASPAGGGPAVVTAGAPAANGPKAFPADNHESGFPMEPDQPAAALSSLFGKLPAAPVEVAQTSEGPLPFGPRPSRPAGQCVRTPRKRPNLIPKKLRGLPSDSDLEKLATAYVRFQNKAWPAFVADGTLPPLTQELIQLMVEDFKVRHMTGQVNMAGAPKSGVTLGTEYLRYSCDLSNPLSLEDQQNNILVKARQADVFVGWFGVFADAGVSGADPSRQGYSSLKVAIATIPELKVIFLDDFSRGGRNIFEWWVLATLVSSTGKNILTADGSFDLSGSFGMMLLSVFGFFSKHFLEQLSGKVLRGMRGAARRDGVVGRLPLGYGMLPMVDAQGNLKLDPEGQVMNTWLVHLATSCYVLRAGEMYGEEGKSPREIADYFNENMVDGSNRWTASSIRRLLWNPMYIGVYIYNRLRTVVDPQSGKRKRLENPRSQWDIRHDKDWAIWPEPLYRKVRRRLYAAGVESPNFGRRRRNRDSNAVTSWFTDVGICACGNRLYATRGGENASLACLKGRSNLNDCTMDSAKAARIVEEELLDHIMTHLLRKNVSLRVAVMANSYVDRLAAQPAANTTALEAERDDLKLEQQRYIKLVGTGHFDVSAEDGDGLAEVRRNISSLGRRISELNSEIAARKNQKRVLAPLTLAEVQSHMSDLRELMAQKPGAAGEAIRALTGPVTVSHEPYGTKKGGRWILSFTPSVADGLATRAVNASARQTLAAFADYERDGREPVRLVVDKRRSEQDRLADLLLPFVNVENPTTGRLYSATDLAERFNKTPALTYVAWRQARRKHAAQLAAPARSAAAGGIPAA